MRTPPVFSHSINVSAPTASPHPGEGRLTSASRSIWQSSISVHHKWWCSLVTKCMFGKAQTLWRFFSPGMTLPQDPSFSRIMVAPFSATSSHSSPKYVKPPHQHIQQLFTSSSPQMITITMVLRRRNGGRCMGKWDGVLLMVLRVICTCFIA